MHFYHEYSSKFAFKYLFAHKKELNNDEKFLQRCASLVNAPLVNAPLIHLWHKLLLFVAVRCLFVFLNSQENHEKRKRKMLNYLTAACLVQPTRRLSRDFVSKNVRR